MPESDFSPQMLALLEMVARGRGGGRSRPSAAPPGDMQRQALVAAMLRARGQSPSAGGGLAPVDPIPGSLGVQSPAPLPQFMSESDWDAVMRMQSPQEEEKGGAAREFINWFANMLAGKVGTGTGGGGPYGSRVFGSTVGQNVTPTRMVAPGVLLPVSDLGNLSPFSGGGGGMPGRSPQSRAIPPPPPKPALREKPT